MATDLIARPAECPSRERLKGLLQGEASDRESSTLTEHLGGCAKCQERIEILAIDGDPNLSGAVLHIDKTLPPKQSAMWKALEAAEASATGDFRKTDSSGEFKLDFLAPSADPDSIGRIGTFEVRRLIGRGGMGAVLLAHDPSLNRDVAIKVLDPQLEKNDTARLRFIREAKAAASVTHENLVGVYQVADPQAALPYMVMQLINGETLEERIRRVGKLPVGDVIRIAAQIAAGLTAAHASGLIHRDIKPGNILIEAGTEKAVLTDFGLARAVEDLKLTRSGFVAGTPLYMAPEQARGEEIDSRSDLFSLGSVLYESLTGKPPFEGTTPLAVLRRIADNEHPRLRRLNRQVPDWLEDVIDQMLAKNPRDRIQTAGELAELFAAHSLGALPTAAQVPCALSPTKSLLFGRWRRRKSLAVSLIFGAPFLAGILGGSALTWGLQPAPEVRVERAVEPSTTAVIAPIVGPDAIATLRGESGVIWSVSSSKDGRFIAAGQEDGTIKLWDTVKKSARTLGAEGEGHKGPVWAVNLSPTGDALVSGGDEGYLLYWNLTLPANGSGPQKPVRVEQPSSVRAVAVHWEARRVVIGDRAGTVSIFEYEEQAPLRQYSHGSSVTGVTFAGDALGMTVASAGTDKKIVTYEIPTSRRLLTFNGHKGPVYAVASSRDGAELATGSWDGTVILWETNSGATLKQFEAHEDGVLAIDYACCGKMIATAGQDGVVKLWDVDQGVLLATFARHKGAVNAVRFTDDGKQLVTGGRDGTVRIWQVRK